MRTLLYGGSFNPPHLGHEDAVRGALAHGWAERLLIVPTAASPHKTFPALSPSPAERLQLCELAYEEFTEVEISDIELKRGGVSYTADTVEALAERSPGDEFGLMMGTDMFLTLENWRRSDFLLSSCLILVVPRSEGELPALREQAENFRRRFGARVEIMEKAPLVLSSTDVRRVLPERGGRELLSENVYAEIIRKRYYGAKSDLAWLREQAYALLKPKRIPHVQGCEEMAVALAERWGVDRGSAAEAAILHDCTKKLGKEEQLHLCEKYGIILDMTERSNEQLLHSKTGAALAADRFGADESISSAIFWHTTGKEDMTVLEKILYLSDAMEPTRDYPGVEKLRNLAFEDLDQAMVLGLRMSLDTVKKRGQKTHDRSAQALAWLISEEESKS